MQLQLLKDAQSGAWADLKLRYVCGEMALAENAARRHIQVHGKLDSSAGLGALTNRQDLVLRYSPQIDLHNSILLSVLNTQLRLALLSVMASLKSLAQANPDVANGLNNNFK